jgi:ribosomal protein S27E
MFRAGFIPDCVTLGRGGDSLMPIPKHLQKCVIPNESKIDESPLIGRIHCSCGSESFELLYHGKAHKSEEELIPCDLEVDGRFFFLIKAKCSQCANEYLIFDKDFHGWNGLVCHDSKQAAIARPELTTWKCTECNSLPHNAWIRISTMGKQDFIEETEGEFEENSWPEAFDWITINIRCPNCNKKTDEWVSYETM